MPLARPDNSSFELLAVKLCGPSLNIIAALCGTTQVIKYFHHWNLLTTFSATASNVILMQDFKVHFHNTDIIL